MSMYIQVGLLSTDPGPLDKVRFNGVFLLPSSHTARFHLDGDTILMPYQIISLTFVSLSLAKKHVQRHKKSRRRRRRRSQDEFFWCQNESLSLLVLTTVKQALLAIFQVGFHDGKNVDQENPILQNLQKDKLGNMDLGDEKSSPIVLIMQRDSSV
ncbi:unnamed protein product [Clavelina lepadiformis]|uniref:Uncharacterized protein n=1 Tax=Clavelina lepadiformis TaxID=159417 RepID=A0ABP0EYR1_CLALP